MNILLTGAAGPAGRALLAQFADLPDHRVVGVDMNPFEHPALDHFRQVPAASDPAMIDVLVDLVREHRIDVLIPTVQEELPTIAAARDRLRPATVVIGGERAVRDAADKYRTMLALDARGVSVPRFTCPEYHRSADSVIAAVGEHVILKPRSGRGSRGVRELHLHAGDAIDWAASPGLVLQEFAPGEEYAPMAYPGAEPIAVVVEKHSNENFQADSVRRIDCPDVAQLALDAARALRLTGPVDVDVRRLASGQPVVLEVNARFGANSAHAPELLAAVLRDAARLRGLA